MAQYGLENIRNLALLAHNGAGKTSLAEAILFNTKIINRLGKVSEGSTTSDYDPAEQKRGMSISLSMLPYIWQGNKINLMDTPGYPDFIGEVKSAIRVSEGAVIVVCASSGVEVGTEQVWASATPITFRVLLILIEWTVKTPILPKSSTRFNPNSDVNACRFNYQSGNTRLFKALSTC